MKTNPKRTLIVILLTLGLSCPWVEGAYMYKATMVRAAPGELLNLIEFYKSYFQALRRAGDPEPLWMRHSQGDQWDLLILFPIGSLIGYYSHGRNNARVRALKQAGIESADVGPTWRRMVAWHEDIYVDGPPVNEVHKALKGAGFYHVEMFRALPGKFDDLVDQRRRENVYLKHLERPQNLIFTHKEGAAWDCFTIGPYRDIKHFAESADIPQVSEDGAAKAAGFESASQIGPFLRTLISEHHDTLAVAVP